MKIILSVLSLSVLLSACSSKQESPVEINNDLLFKIEEIEKESSSLKKAATINKKEVVEYKHAEKKLIKELKERFKNIKTDEDAVFVKEEPETVVFSSPEPLKTKEVDESIVNNIENTENKLNLVETEKPVGVVGSINIEEKDSFKEEQNYAWIKKIIFTAVLIIFLILCLYVGLKKK